MWVEAGAHTYMEKALSKQVLQSTEIFALNIFQGTQGLCVMGRNQA